MVVPGAGLSQGVPLVIVLSRRVAHLQRIILRGHPQGNRQPASQQHTIVAAEGRHVVETKETVFKHDGRILEPGRIVWQQVVEPLIDIADSVLQEIVVLDTLIDKSL